MRLSVCFFAHSSLLAGAQRSLLELVTELIGGHGFRCAVVLPEDGPLAPLLEAAGARTIFGAYSWWGRKNGDPAALAEGLTESMEDLLTRVLPQVATFAPDVIVTQTLVIPWGAVAAALLGVPHAWHACEFGPRDSSLTFFAPGEAILETIRTSSSLVFVPSLAVERELFAGLPEGRCLRIGRHVAIAPEDLAAPPPPVFSRPGALRLGLFATLTEDKGQRIALSALAELLRRGRDVELIFAGPPAEPFAGDLARAIREEGLESRARIVGFLEKPYPLMAATDIVLAPFRHEAFARVVLEAMTLGKTIVASDTGALPELIRDGVTGLLVPHGDAGKLADRVEELIADREKAGRLGENALRFATENFPPESYGGKAARALLSLKGSGPSGFPRILLPSLLSAATRLSERRPREERLRELLEDRDAKMAELSARVESLESAADGLGWKLLSAYWQALDRLLPRGSRRRRLYRRLRGRDGAESGAARGQTGGKDGR